MDKKALLLLLLVPMLSSMAWGGDRVVVEMKIQGRGCCGQPEVVPPETAQTALVGLNGVLNTSLINMYQIAVIEFDSEQVTIDQIYITLMMAGLNAKVVSIQNFQGKELASPEPKSACGPAEAFC